MMDKQEDRLSNQHDQDSDEEILLNEDENKIQT